VNEREIEREKRRPRQWQHQPAHHRV